MSEHDSKAGTTYSAASALAFNLLSILVFPISLIGYVIIVINLLSHGKTSGVSSTAQGPLTRALDRTQFRYPRG